MEAQTLQQQVPVYHVCQQCNGAGCQACSDLLILDGDIQLDPEWVDELPEPSPINGVIGTTADDYSSIESRLAHVNKLAARFPYRVQNAGINRDVLCDCADSSPKYDISFDDRNMYQRREDELRLAGEWEV